MVTDSRLLQPNAHRFRDVVEDKRRRVHEPHVVPLNRLVEEINQGRPYRAPWLDADGGGTGARVLFLHENPGRRATSERESGSGFISADDTAANFFRLRDQAGLPRDQLAAWNIVPWYQPDGERTSNATLQDVADALPWLTRLVRLLPELRLVVEDHLAHVLDHCETDEPSGAWTGLACPDHGLALGGDVDNETLRRLSAHGEIADLIWEPRRELAAEHGQLLQASCRPSRSWVAWSACARPYAWLTAVSPGPGLRNRDPAYVSGPLPEPVRRGARP